MEIKIKNKTYYVLRCEKCNITFNRRIDEFKKNLEKCNNKILCKDCMRSRKRENIKAKLCNKCGIVKDITDFYKKKNGYCCYCKSCMDKSNKEWYKNNKEKVRERNKRYREENKGFMKECTQNWKSKNKEHIKEYKRKKYHKDKKDNFYKLKIQTRHLIFKAFERKGYKKGSKTEEILGCNYETFINHLLETYKNNYGAEWDKIESLHIDHVIPISTAKSEEEIIKLNHYTNLQLLKAEDNLHKSNKLDWRLKSYERR